MGRALRSRHDRQVKSDRGRSRQSPPAVLIVEDDLLVAEAAAEAIEDLRLVSRYKSRECLRK